MKIAIQKTTNSFSDRWINYCEEKKIPYKIVNCYDSEILTQLVDCDGLMWHWTLNDYKAALFARQLALSLEKKGVKVFPDVNTAWHYDDKVGQKYLLEAIGAPTINSYIFYSKKEAVDWLEKTNFPKVFKLRGGAGSVNVSIIKNKKKARRLINKAFGKGFSHINRINRLKDRVWVLKRDKNLLAFKDVLKGIVRIFIPTEVEKYSTNEKGYIYFQDFIPNNEYDTRLVVVGDRCFGIRRYCRKGDFRASGSGLLAYEPELFERESIEIAFDISKKLSTQSIAFDFIKSNGQNKIVEISYCYTMGKSYDNCQGYWDSKLNWHQKAVNPQYFIIEDFVNSL